MGAGGHLVGRDSERELIAALLRESAQGRPGALLVAGEPGIGKTSLVADVTSGPASDGHLVLWGRCLRFGADSAPYLPFTQMLTQWHRQADDSERAEVLRGAEHLATIAPSLGEPAAGAVDTTRMFPLVAALLDRIGDTTPLVLVVDDVQWADGTSLDLLAYLLAGFGAEQHLGVVVTYRDTDLGEGHRLHGWLADVTRLPSVSRMHLERLGFADTVELVARLGGGEVSSRAGEVFDKAGGNPYYTELLVRGSGGGTGPESDTDLRQALLGSWHRLGRHARELLQLLAVGGRPVDVEVLEGLVAIRGGSPDDVTSALAEAGAAGLLAAGPEREAWFHHPLIAEVVATTLPAAARSRIHDEYVKVLQRSTDLTPASRAAHLALHHHGAGNPDDAFSWSLRAAEEAAAVRAYAEVSDHLHRACRLWPEVDEGVRSAAGDRADLWRRASEAAWSAGEYLLAVRLREEAVALVDTALDPIGAVRLRLPLLFWRPLCGLEGFALVESVQPLVDLAANVCPGTAEHAQTLARLAWAEGWNDRHVLARRHAAEAVRIARRTGSAEALAWTLGMRSQTRTDATSGLADLRQAVTMAREVGDPELLGVMAIGGANCFERLGRRTDAAELLLTTFRRLLETGSAHEATWAQPHYCVALLIELGRWGEARDLLRELLSGRHPPAHAAGVRGAAAVLALRSGDVSAGLTHLTRARELASALGIGDLLSHAYIEGDWASGNLTEALEQAATLMSDRGQPDALNMDELLVLAGHIAADLAEQPGRRQEARILLDRVEAVRGTEPARFVPTVPSDLLHPAYGLIFAAEQARCHGAPDAASKWRAAVTACRPGIGLVWEEALACYQLARALLAAHGPRQEAAAALRRGAKIASDLGATPILRDVEALARQAHIPLEEPTAAGPEPGAQKFPASRLTVREREVLAHLVAGRTYAEIAQALFISEKTVSVHVSNLLRKTGTTSRIEVSDLVRRTAPGQAG